jgi:hypothetical protein
LSKFLEGRQTFGDKHAQRFYQAERATSNGSILCVLLAFASLLGALQTQSTHWKSLSSKEQDCWHFWLQGRHRATRMRSFLEQIGGPPHGRAPCLFYQVHQEEDGTGHPLLDLLLSQGDMPGAGGMNNASPSRFVLNGCLREPAERFPCCHLFSDAIIGTALRCVMDD